MQALPPAAPRPTPASLRLLCLHAPGAGLASFRREKINRFRKLEDTSVPHQPHRKKHQQSTILPTFRGHKRRRKQSWKSRLRSGKPWGRSLADREISRAQEEVESVRIGYVDREASKQDDVAKKGSDPDVEQHRRRLDLEQDEPVAEAAADHHPRRLLHALLHQVPPHHPPLLLVVRAAAPPLGVGVRLRQRHRRQERRPRRQGVRAAPLRHRRARALQDAGVRPLAAASRARRGQRRPRRRHRLRHRQRRGLGRRAPRAEGARRRLFDRRPPGQVPRRGRGGVGAAAARAGGRPGVHAADGDGAQVRVPAGAHLAAAGGARREVGRGRRRRAERGRARGARTDGRHLHGGGARPRGGRRRPRGRGGARRAPHRGAVVRQGVPLRGQPRRRQRPPLALPRRRRRATERLLLHQYRPDLVGTGPRLQGIAEVFVHRRNRTKNAAFLEIAAARRSAPGQLVV